MTLTTTSGRASESNWLRDTGWQRALSASSAQKIMKMRRMNKHKKHSLPVCQEDSDCDQPYSDGKFTFAEQEVGSALDINCECSHPKGDEISNILPENQNDHEQAKGQEPVAPRLCRELPQKVEHDIPWDPLDEYYLTSSDLPGLSNSYCPYRNAATISFEELEVYSALDIT
ncbi:neuroblastoma breakpoint family member 6-like [Equus quagga]|uniref:neuroblastoma breakpoint family member 6-like n=1 Tax=Equus quagga TaxID=89248 RepID=UPI001EE29C28|nr:neuroblastoma breakpoint family member 6-like [Equus quagga]XP_046507300.1 neuroblastoma breakpoint family member 6-like [Equus quagga]